MVRCCGITQQKIKVSLSQTVNIAAQDWSTILFQPEWDDAGKDVAYRRVKWYFVVNSNMAHAVGFLPTTANLLITPSQKIGEDIALPNGVGDITAFLQANGAVIYNGDLVEIYAQIQNQNATSLWSNPVSYRVVDDNASCEMPLLTYDGRPLLTHDGSCLLPYSV